MANYKSRYTGQQVDDAIGSLQGLDGVVGIVKIDADGNFSGETLAGLKEELGSMPASDVYDWAKAETKPTYTAEEVGAIATSAKGAADGVVPLNSQLKIDSAYLPSFVDDVLEYATQSAFPQEGEGGKIYVDLSTNKTYRWGGSIYVEISPSTVVTVSRDLTEGTKSAVITIDGTQHQLYAPTNTDTVINLTARGTSKAYVLGTTTAPNASVQSATGVAETGVYIETSDGATKIVAPNFVGNLTGVASGNLTANSSLSWNKLTNIPDTLAAHGIEDVKIENGTITIGNETIRPIVAETDPIFTNSAAGGITNSDIANWNSKTSNIGTITSIKTNSGSHTTINISNGAAEFNVPTKVSQLANDKGFLTADDITPSSGVFAVNVEPIGTIQTTTGGTSNDFVRGNHVHAITKTTIDTVIGVNSDTTKFYRNDGTWAAPMGTVNAIKLNGETKNPVNGVVDLGTISIVAVNNLTTTAGQHQPITNQTGNVSLIVPTNTSHLVNDANFTSVQITRW